MAVIDSLAEACAHLPATVQPAACGLVGFLGDVLLVVVGIALGAAIRTAHERVMGR